MKKELRDIPGFPGYRISNYGEVYSLWCGSGPSARIGNALRRMKTSVVDGREHVTLRGGGRAASKRVHRLVLEAFVGPCPRGMECCHFPDRDTTNNRLDNLRWDTKQSNYADRVAHNTCNRGTRNGSSKLTEDDVRDIRKRKATGLTYRELAAEYGVSLSAIQQVWEGKTWAWVK